MVLEGFRLGFVIENRGTGVVEFGSYGREQVVDAFCLLAGGVEGGGGGEAGGVSLLGVLEEDDEIADADAE